MLDPRRVAGLLDVPGCRRRHAVDAAMIDSATLTQATGADVAGRSPFAHERNGTFAQLALEQLPALVATEFGVPIGPIRSDLPLAEVLGAGDGLFLLRDAILPLGRLMMRVELMVLASTSARLHLVEIRSYASVDGQADPSKVAGTARELAAAVLALRQYAGDNAAQPERLSSRALLVLPRNFGLTPVGAVLDVAPQMRRLAPVLRRLDDAPPLAFREPEELAAQLRAIEARFGDGCPRCQLYRYCGDLAARDGKPSQAGSNVVNVCGPVDTVDRALALAHGETDPTDDSERAMATELSRAAQAYRWAGRAGS